MRLVDTAGVSEVQPVPWVPLEAGAGAVQPAFCYGAARCWQWPGVRVVAEVPVVLPTHLPEPPTALSPAAQREGMGRIVGLVTMAGAGVAGAGATYWVAQVVR